MPASAEAQSVSATPLGESVSATPLGESARRVSSASQSARQLPRTTSAGLQIGASKFQRAVSKPNFATTRVTKSN